MKINGATLTREPATDQPREMTLADLKLLIDRMKAAEQRMGDDNEHRPLLRECGWWLVNFANRHIEMSTTLADLQAKVAAVEQEKIQHERRIILPGEF